MHIWYDIDLDGFPAWYGRAVAGVLALITLALAIVVGV